MRLTDLLVPKVRKQKKARKIVIIGLIITGILSVSLGVVTYFGFQTGYNYIRVEPGLLEYGIRLSKYPSLSNRVDSLVIDSVEDDALTEIDKSWIDFDLRNDEVDLDEGQFGIHFDENEEGTSYINYGIYQFYLINESTLSQNALDIDFLISISHSANDLEKAIGIKVFISDYDLDTYESTNEEEFSTFFIRGSKIDIVDENNVNKIIESTKTNKTDFLSIKKFNPKQVKRITLFFWLDGNITTDSMEGGMVRINAEFRVRKATGDV